MPISFVRIDDRVIHGQVIARWSRLEPCNGILVVDDEIANDQIQKMIFSNAVPNDIKIGIYTTKEGVEKINKAREAKNSYFVIVKTPIYLQRLVELGADFGKKINVGPMSARDNAKNIGKNVAITEEEIEAFEFLYKSGIKISFQLVPEETQYKWDKIRSKLI